MSFILDFFKPKKQLNENEIRKPIIASFINKWFISIPKHCHTLKSKKINLKNNKFAIVIENVYTKLECQELIKNAEIMGYPATLKIKDNLRINQRIMVNDSKLSKDMFLRIKKFIPKIWKNRKIVGLNERLRILRYNKGNLFKSHFDGEYRRDNGQRSYITFLLYLNECGKDFNGGNTVFYNCGKNVEIEEGVSHVSVVPKQGMVVLFEHRILHKGGIVVDGRKYIIRSDVMYSNKVCT